MAQLQVNIEGATGGVTSPYGYGLAPESPHILWTRQYFPTGSITDERFGTLANRYGGYQAVSWADGSNPRWQNSHHQPNRLYMMALVVRKFLIYTQANHYTTTLPQLSRHSDKSTTTTRVTSTELNVYLWKTSGITLPQVVRVPRVQYLGPNRLPLRLAENIEINRTATPYAINVTGTVRELLDAYTGNTICYIANCLYCWYKCLRQRRKHTYTTTPPISEQPQHPNYYLQVWNSSAGTMVASQSNTGAWQWRPSGGSGSGASVSYFGAVASNNVHDGNIMWSLNASMPSILGPRNALVNQTATIRAVREGEYIIFSTEGRNDERGVVQGWAMCISLKRGQEGQKLWESTWTPPLANSGWYNADIYEGVFPEQEVIIYASETLLKYYAFDMKTGNKLWESCTYRTNELLR